MKRRPRHNCPNLISSDRGWSGERRNQPKRDCSQIERAQG